ncbi:type III polyketide synthase [Virgibacillus siamensis]|uniref:type III polyketide synthase n=1 Tax=Virgibacillus siamensis TaxID=480071 RepID=UPI0009876EBF|nr:3-oxoacyl-[acyl-carrier-protein] synthase III C-terminal domain-containing protein [Virgibacillus siamensis]
MAYISSVGKGIPKYNINQHEVRELVRDIFSIDGREARRFLPVFDHAKIENRQFVTDANWFGKRHTFKEKNDLYRQHAVTYSLQAMDDCLSNEAFLTKDIPYEAIDLIIFVSSTGLSTPSIDTTLMNKRPFRDDVFRMPLWGLGCAGGAIGLARAFDWLSAHPDKNVLLVCCELCSLTFQIDDRQKSNLIGTALFGDGISSVLLTGETSPYTSYHRNKKPFLRQTNTRTMKNSEDVMGWDVTNNGLEVVFSKSIPSLVKSFWSMHIDAFLTENNISQDAIYSFVAHPGGLKVLKAMEEVLDVTGEKFRHSYQVLRDHGNMSSATVLYVLDKWMRESIPDQELGIISALGPGFSSELLLMEWGKS